jgi:hypothetical protein
MAKAKAMAMAGPSSIWGRGRAWYVLGMLGMLVVGGGCGGGGGDDGGCGSGWWTSGLLLAIGGRIGGESVSVRVSMI